ncbi:MAG: NUDIX domain-containing protein [Patescibacteria group bacterium]
MKTYRCLIHGSLRKHLAEILEAKRCFEANGIQVLSPPSEIAVGEDAGFVFFPGEQGLDPRLVEIRFLEKLKSLDRDGFSYFVCPDGYLGPSAAYELGLALAYGIPCYFSAELVGHPAFVPSNMVIDAASLGRRIVRHGLPQPRPGRSVMEIFRSWRRLVAEKTSIAAGGIIEHTDRRGRRTILLVRTHKWHDRFSVVGGKVKPDETLRQALRREIREETGLEASVGRHLCTFDQLRGSGYYRPETHHVFVDYVARVQTRRVRLNEEAEGSVWLPAAIALRDLPLEPNARRTVEAYIQTTAAT